MGPELNGNHVEVPTLYLNSLAVPWLVLLSFILANVLNIHFPFALSQLILVTIEEGAEKETLSLIFLTIPGYGQHGWCCHSVFINITVPPND